jgi:hypothetical protein
MGSQPPCQFGRLHEFVQLYRLLHSCKTEGPPQVFPASQDARSAGVSVSTPGPSGASNQAHLQRLDALKAGITRDHHGIRTQLQAASRLQCIGCA